jgi:hypothetical protein
MADTEHETKRKIFFDTTLRIVTICRQKGGDVHGQETQEGQEG